MSAPGARCLSLTLSSLLQRIVWVRCVSVSMSFVSELCQCGRDTRRQRIDLSLQRSGRQRSGSTQATEVSALFKRAVAMRGSSGSALCQCGRKCG